MDGLVLGLDLCDGYTQLSCDSRDQYWSFPTAICRKTQEDSWLVGEEAYASALLGEGVIIDKLLKMVVKDGTATIHEIKYQGIEILEKFLEKVLELPLGETEQERPSIAQLVITIPRIETKLVDSLMYCADHLGIPRTRIHVISHTESFLYYVLSQKREVWNNQVGMFDLSQDCLCYYEMKVQRGLRQVTVVAEREKLDEGFSLDILDSASGIRLADKILCACGERFLQKKLFSSVFLTGKGFEKQDWAPGFTKLLCASRRKVYQEPALFAKGAAYRALDLLRDKTAYPYVMICDGRLNMAVTLKVMHQNQETQLVLAAAGDSWYEAKSTVELILEDQQELELTLTSADAKKKRVIKLELEEFPVRKDKSVRVQLQIGFLDDKTMAVAVRDMGFGDFYPSTGVMIRQEVRI